MDVSDRGLFVGYRYARSITTGTTSIFRSSDFQGLLPRVDNFDHSSDDSDEDDQNR